MFSCFVYALFYCCSSAPYSEHPCLRFYSLLIRCTIVAMIRLPCSWCNRLSSGSLIFSSSILTSSRRRNFIISAT
uniref:Putative secreted protein n=1 Tax=Anopheles darlingi TaxID=43151 RepID=A0A2M4D4R1_ANODA